MSPLITWMRSQLSSALWKGLADTVQKDSNFQFNFYSLAHIKVARTVQNQAYFLIRVQMFRIESLQLVGIVGQALLRTGDLPENRERYRQGFLIWGFTAAHLIVVGVATFAAQLVQQLIIWIVVGVDLCEGEGETIRDKLDFYEGRITLMYSTPVFLYKSLSSI